MIGIIVAILRVGAAAVRANAKMSSSLEHLTEALRELKQQFDIYVTTDQGHHFTLSGWQREVDSRLSGMEATLGSLIERRQKMRP